VKALAITERTDKSNDPFILLTSDQIVLFGTEVREKPTSGAQAVEFLSSYSNREVSTISAVVATHFPSGSLNSITCILQDAGYTSNRYSQNYSGKQSHEMVKATVSFGEISEDIVQIVVAKGEIYSSAGGFRIEDEHLNPLILNIEGSADSVLGMPMDATVRVIRAVIDALP
jgi:septum formation protein